MISGRGGMGTSKHRKVPRHKIPALNAATKAAIERYYRDARPVRPVTAWFSSIHELFASSRRLGLY